jgi:hypothetical protein
MIVMKAFLHPLVLSLLLVILTSCAISATPSRKTATITVTAEPDSGSSVNSTELVMDIQWMKNNAAITLESNGKTITFPVATRFSVFLDDDKYPVKALTCNPTWIIGYISNGSLRGPGRYPIMYEATVPGECTLRDGDFTVKIVVVSGPHY